MDCMYKDCKSTFTKVFEIPVISPTLKEKICVRLHFCEIHTAVIEKQYLFMTDGRNIVLEDELISHGRVK